MDSIENNQEYFCVLCSGNLELKKENEFVCCICSSLYGKEYILSSQLFLNGSESENIIIPESIINETISSFKELCNIELDDTYYIASSARADFQERIQFYEEVFQPNLIKWETDILEKNSMLTEIKISLVTEIYNISKSIIRDYFNPFISNTEQGVYESFLDIDQYKLDIDSQQFLEISQACAAPTVLDVLSDVTDKVNFKKLNKSLNNLSSSSDRRRRKAQNNINKQTVDFAFNAIEAGISAIKNNGAAIKAIREANEEFDQELFKVENNIKGYDIQQKEVIKKLRYANIQTRIFDTCLNNFMKVISEFERNELFQEFKQKQSRFFRCERLIVIIKDLLNQNVSIPFWHLFFKNEAELFKIIFDKKLSKISNKEEFQNLASEFNFRPVSNIDMLALESDFIKEYHAFHEEYKPKLKALEGYNETKEHVMYFANVLKTIKQFINN